MLGKDIEEYLFNTVHINQAQRLVCHLSASPNKESTTHQKKASAQVAIIEGRDVAAGELLHGRLSGETIPAVAF